MEVVEFFIALAIFSNEGGRNRHFASGALTGPRDHGKPSALSTNHSCAGKTALIKPDLGTKRVCPSCAARFYDLQKRPIECPKCAFAFEPDALLRQRRPRTPDAAKEGTAETQAANGEIESKTKTGVEAQSEDEELLEDAEDELEEDTGPGMSVSDEGDEDDDDGDDELGDEQDLDDDLDDNDLGADIDDDEDEDPDDLDDELDDDLDDDEDDDTLLEEEDDDDDVSTIIDADIEQEEG